IGLEFRLAVDRWLEAGGEDIQQLAKTVDIVNQALRNVAGSVRQIVDVDVQLLASIQVNHGELGERGTWTRQEDVLWFHVAVDEWAWQAQKTSKDTRDELTDLERELRTETTGLGGVRADPLDEITTG